MVRVYLKDAVRDDDLFQTTGHGNLMKHEFMGLLLRSKGSGPVYAEIDLEDEIPNFLEKFVDYISYFYCRPSKPH